MIDCMVKNWILYFWNMHFLRTPYIWASFFYGSVTAPLACFQRCRFFFPLCLLSVSLENYVSCLIIFSLKSLSSNLKLFLLNKQTCMKKSYKNSYPKGLQDLCSYPNTNYCHRLSTVHDSQILWDYCKALKTYTHRHTFHH